MFFPSLLQSQVQRSGWFFLAFLVMLQLDIMFEHTIPSNLRFVGCPNIPCASWAAFASSTSRLVKFSMLFQTVLMVPWIRHRATSASTSLRLRNGITWELFFATMSPSFVWITKWPGFIPLLELHEIGHIISSTFRGRTLATPYLFSHIFLIAPRSSAMSIVVDLEIVWLQKPRKCFMRLSNR
jgi:hypothetical protein